jgi:hypothetical protein
MFIYSPAMLARITALENQVSNLSVTIQGLALEMEQLHLQTTPIVAPPTQDSAPLLQAGPSQMIPLGAAGSLQSSFIQEVPLTKPFGCLMCSRSLISRHSLSQHKYSAHKSTEATAQWHCNQCNQDFTEADFEEHDSSPN